MSELVRMIVVLDVCNARFVQRCKALQEILIIFEIVIRITFR